MAGSVEKRRRYIRRPPVRIAIPLRRLQAASIGMETFAGRRSWAAFVGGRMASVQLPRGPGVLRVFRTGHRLEADATNNPGRRDTSIRCRAREETPNNRRESTEYRRAEADNNSNAKPAPPM